MLSLLLPLLADSLPSILLSNVRDRPCAKIEVQHLYSWLKGIHPSKFTEFLYNRITKNQTLAYIYLMTGVTKGEKIPSQLILIFVSEIKNEEYYNSNWQQVDSPMSSRQK